VRRTKKTRWQIGRDYERFIGYKYETRGYEVEFTGAVEGLHDMPGRGLRPFLGIVCRGRCPVRDLALGAGDDAMT
jgi:hypothetical protein